MDALVVGLEQLEEDQPIDRLARRRLFGENMLWAHVRLAAGCHVAQHSHPNEQIAFVISGCVRWRLGAEGSAEYREQEVCGGTVVHLPGGFPHGVDAVEDTVILDVLSPPGEMGVDRQGAAIDASRTREV